MIFVLLLVLPGPVSLAQDDTSSDNGDSTEIDTNEITFDEPEDISLFVGHYRLNPGDTVYIEIISDVASTFNAMIDEDGFVTLPVIGRVMIADLTASEARETIQLIADKYYRNSWITLKVSQIAKVKFYIYGDVRGPGFYTAPGTTTFLDFLQKFRLAGSASHRRIVHVKGDINTALPEPVDIIGGERETSSALIARSLQLFGEGQFVEIDPDVTVLDPLDFTIEGEIERKNFYLEYGDIIYVPDPVVTVNLEGFRRPGFYEVLPGESWADIIRLAGDPSQLRDISNIVLERRDDDGELSQLYYNLNLLGETELASLPIENRDNLRAMNYEVNVYVLGEVNLAGAFAYSPTMTPLDYLAMAGGETPESHLKFAKIIRPPRDPGAPLEESEIFDVDLVESIVHGTPQSTIAMQPGDILYIPPKGTQITIATVLSGLSVLVNTVRLF